MNKYCRGFTLVELLVYLVIASSVISVAGGFAVFSMRVNAENTSARNAYDTVRAIASQVSKDMRTATGIVAPTSSTVGSSLSLLTPSGTITYALNQGSLFRTQGNTTIALGSTRVQAIRFENVSTPGAPPVVIATVTIFIGNTNTRTFVMSYAGIP